MISKHLIYNQFKVSLIIFLILYSFQSYSQKQKNDPREVEDIRLIMNNIFNNKIKTPTFYFKEVTYELPLYFTGYDDYRKMLINYKITAGFVKSKLFNLNKKDCDKLNISITNDTAKVYIQKDWFTGVKVKILSDSITKFNAKSYTRYIKPIFFRNNSRCFIAIYDSDNIESFFLKKKFNNWVLDKTYILLIND